ncbi:50S ribosomal protein L5 [Patescibacteria group bacterium]
MTRLQEIYKKDIAPKMQKEFGLKSIMAVPRLQKVVVNTGIGDFKDNKDAIESFVNELGQLLGQTPHPRKARLSVAGFKIRKGDVVGYSATLRRDKMWAFFDKLVSIAIPRIRDFRGLNPNSFDEAGNYSFGITEHVIFPEVNPNTIKGVRSLQVTIVSSSNDKKLNKALLNYLGMPFKKEA